ncbi:hypothetical protein N7501_004397 [Penicillium viridicatum]|nr:hypothetical protein N7501_004397 [Penicillium viridicatum]
MSTKLFVVFYRPRYGNFLHWALHIEKGQEHHILEVDGEHPQFERNTFMENPKKSSTFLRQFFIAVLGEDDVERVKSAAQSVPMDNETVEWDCQDYVLEILDKLQEDFIWTRMMKITSMVSEVEAAADAFIAAIKLDRLIGQSTFGCKDTQVAF